MSALTAAEPNEPDDTASLLGEGLHTAFRKATEHPMAAQIHRLIRDLPDHEWYNILCWVVEGAQLATDDQRRGDGWLDPTQADQLRRKVNAPRVGEKDEQCGGGACVKPAGHESHWNGAGEVWVHIPHTDEELEAAGWILPEQAEALRDARDRTEDRFVALVEQRDQARALAATCSCGTSPMTHEGPEPDCPVHGAVRALNQAMAERAAWLPVIDAARRAVAGAYAAAAKGLSFYVRQDLVDAVDALDRGVPDA